MSFFKDSVFANRIIFLHWFTILSEFTLEILASSSNLRFNSFFASSCCCCRISANFDSSSFGFSAFFPPYNSASCLFKSNFNGKPQLPSLVPFLGQGLFKAIKMKMKLFGSANLAFCNSRVFGVPVRSREEEHPRKNPPKKVQHQTETNCTQLQGHCSNRVSYYFFREVNSTKHEALCCFMPFYFIAYFLRLCCAKIWFFCTSTWKTPCKIPSCFTQWTKVSESNIVI